MGGCIRSHLATSFGEGLMSGSQSRSPGRYGSYWGSGGGHGARPSTGDWACHKCDTKRNWHTRGVCRGCGEVRAGQAIALHDKVRETADLSAKAPWRADSGGSSQDHNLAGAQQGKRVPTQVESLLASLESAKAGGAEAAVLACIEGALAAAKEARDKARPPKQQMADAEERVKKRKRAQETRHAAHNERSATFMMLNMGCSL